MKSAESYIKLPGNLSAMAEDHSKLWIQLCVDDSKDSLLALRYFKDNGLDVEIKHPTESEIIKALNDSFCTHAAYANSKREPLIPSLFVGGGLSQVTSRAYLSFSGVKCFLRGFRLGSARRATEPYWQKIKTFYSRQNERVVTCFGIDGRNVFEGDISKAPHNLQRPLEEHDFKDWYEVSGWEIGGLERLCKRQDKQGIVTDRRKHAVLFADDIEKLKNNEIIPFTDHRSMYQVVYGAYYNDGGMVCGLYAHMFD